MWRQSSSIYSIIVHLNIGLSTTQHKNTCKLSNLGSYFGFTMIISMCMSLLIHIKRLHVMYLIYAMKGQHSLNKSLHFLNNDNYFPNISLIEPCLSIIFKVQISSMIKDMHQIYRIRLTRYIVLMIGLYKFCFPQILNIIPYIYC